MMFHFQIPQHAHPKSAFLKPNVPMNRWGELVKIHVLILSEEAAEIQLF